MCRRIVLPITKSSAETSKTVRPKTKRSPSLRMAARRSTQSRSSCATSTLGSSARRWRKASRAGLSTSAGVTTTTPGNGFSGSSRSASPRPDCCWNSSSAFSRLTYSASATPGRPLICSRRASPSAVLASSLRYRDICAARCQEPPSRSTLLNSSDKPMGRLRATAITRQVKKLPMGCLPRRRRLSIRLERWLSSQACSRVRKSGPSSSWLSRFFFSGCGSAALGATRSETLGLRVALIARPPRRRSSGRAARSACDGACARSVPGHDWRSARWCPGG
ncbi:hypothetical protein D3C77_281020 [compost metagenome]